MTTLLPSPGSVTTEPDDMPACGTMCTDDPEQDPEQDLRDEEVEAWCVEWYRMTRSNR